MLSRRSALRAGLLTGAAMFIHSNRTTAQAQAPAPAPTGPFTVPPLPYPASALEPHIDAKTMEIHHGKHHTAYVTKLNEAVAKQPGLGEQPIEAILKDLSKVNEEIRKAVRNQGGGHYNHTLFWQMLSPKGGGEPTGALGKAIAAKFGSFADFQKKFTAEAVGVFGSGWAWLVMDGKDLAIDSTPNQDNPISTGKMPLLGLDVWEHAYYLGHQNRRPEYVEAWWKVVNWEFVSTQFEKAKGA